MRGFWYRNQCGGVRRAGEEALIGSGDSVALVAAYPGERASVLGTVSEGSNECLPCLHDAQCPLKRCEKLIRLLARQSIARCRVVVDKHDERLTQGLGRSLFWIVLYAKASHIRAS